MSFNWLTILLWPQLLPISRKKRLIKGEDVHDLEGSTSLTALVWFRVARVDQSDNSCRLQAAGLDEVWKIAL